MSAETIRHEGCLIACLPLLYVLVWVCPLKCHQATARELYRNLTTYQFLGDTETIGATDMSDILSSMVGLHVSLAVISLVQLISFQFSSLQLCTSALVVTDQELTA